jgi:fibronectin type 3 domain-containing protein
MSPGRRTPAVGLLVALAILSAATGGAAQPVPPTNLAAIAVSSNTINLSWTASTSPLVDRYRVYRDGAQVGATSGLEFSDSGLQPWTEYTYRVTAVDVFGQESAPSDAATARTFDDTPPSAPQDLAGTGVSTSQIELTWSAAVDPESGIAEYRVYRDGLLIASTPQTSYSDTGLQPDTHYTYRVSAVNGSGVEGDKSRRAQVRTLPLVPPPPPTGLVAEAVSPTQIDLTWSHPDPGNVNKYRVYRDGAFAAETDNPAYQDTGRTPATTYEYRVSAVDGNGLESELSDPASARTPDATPPTMPQNLSAIGVSPTQIDLSWSASSDPESGIAMYRVYRDGALVGSTTQTSFDDTGLLPVTTYEYRVSAVNGDGLESPRSDPVSATTKDDTPPTRPLNLVASAVSTQQIDLTWSDSSDPETGVAEYRIYREDTGLIGTTEETSFQDMGLQPSTVYTYSVTAVNGDGLESDLSDPATARTLDEIDTTPPPAPSDLTAQAVSPSQINLAWSEVTDPESGVSVYNVYRDDKQVGSTPSSSFSDTGLSPSTTYQYQVSAVNGDGFEGEKSNVASATTLQAPDSTPPTTPTALTAEAASQTQIDLTWAASEDPESGVASYNVFRSGLLIASTATTSFFDTGLQPESTYEYAVSAVNGEGLESDRSAAVSATTFPPADRIPPAPPTGLRVIVP